MNPTSKKTLIVSTLFILFGAFSRLIGFLPNFSALESLALFGGAYIASRYLAIAIPLLAMFVSDLVINNTIARVWYPEHEGFVLFADYMIWNVISLVLIVLFGKVILKKVNLLNGALGILGATMIFWMVTNIGSWLTMPIYSKDLSGLASCFGLALPFLKNSLIGNFIFGTILFSSYEWYYSLSTHTQEVAVS